MVEKIPPIIGENPKRNSSGALSRGSVQSIFLLFALAIPTLTQAQNTLGTSLLGSAGGTHYSGVLGLSFSLGETSIDHTNAATFGVLQHDPLGLPTVSVIDRSINQLNLFPNPNQGKFQLSGLPEGTAYWEVYDLNGKLVESGRMIEPEVSLSFSTSQGFYLLRLLNESRTTLADRKFSIVK